MSTYYKYEKYQKYINGVPTEEYKQGELIGTGDYSSKEDCEKGAIYKWIDSGETICDGYKLCVKEIKQKSIDGGQTWTNTDETRAGTVIDMWSTECGVVIMYEWRPTGNSRCRYFNKEEEYVYQVSYTMGTTWVDVEPRQTKWVVSDVFSDECFLEAEPFTFTFDAGDEGGNLELNTKVDSLYSYWTEDDPTYNSDTGRYSIKYYAIVYTKYAIDWGDGDGPQFYDKSAWEETSDTWSRLEQKPESPFVTTMLKNPMSISNHIYRTGGIKTIKIWGNISYFGCKQVKDFIHWGVPMFNVRINTDQKDLLALLRKKGIKVCDPTYGGCIDKNLTGTKIEGYNNFEKIETTFTGKDFGTMYVFTFKYLTHFDMSNSPNCTYPDPFSRFNQGQLTTFIADNCTGMTDGPDLKYLGGNDNSSQLTKVSFKNCTNMLRGPILEMNTTKIKGGALTKGLNLTADGVFENCPNIQELAFTYAVYVNCADFRHHPKLEKITGILEADDTAQRRFQFYQMCKGMTSLRDIEYLTLRGCGFEEAFMDCTNISQICTTDITSEISNNGGSAALHRMYSNTGIIILDISKIYKNTYNPFHVYCDYMFSNCLKLTTIEGSLQENQQTFDATSFQHMFDGCSKLTTISSIFKEKTTLPDMDYMFYNCNLTSLPNDLFNQTYEDTYPNAPMYMFANNAHLTNYPIDNLIPMWKLPPFFFGEITETYAFQGCTPILAEVPRLWGGYSDVNPVKVRVSIPQSDYTLSYKYSGDYSSSVIMKSADATNLRNDQLHFASSGTYEVDIYLTGTNEVIIPSITTEIISLGDAYDLDYQTFNTAAHEPPITKMPYGKKFCSNYNSFDFMGGYTPPWYRINWITDVDDNILENCGNVTKINGSTYGGVFCMNLSTEKYTTMFSYLTNLQEIHGLFNWYEVSVTSTCGIFKNNPSLTNISEALGNSALQTIAVDEFSNNKELVNVSYLFSNSSQLTNMPNFKENKKITDFSYAFQNCTSLRGSTPTDENGYKLWQRAGKEGYPATINGEHCFRGCTQLDDYNEIPDNWK